MIRERKFISLKDNASTIDYNIQSSVKMSILREPSFVDEFYSEECQPCDDKLCSKTYLDPVYMLFNQERLNDIGKMGIENYLSQFAQKEDPFVELRKQCSDSDLASLIKSKHLQSMSEVTAWTRYMSHNIDLFHSEVEKMIKQRKEAASSKETSPITSSE